VRAVQAARAAAGGGGGGARAAGAALGGGSAPLEPSDDRPRGAAAAEEEELSLADAWELRALLAGGAAGTELPGLLRPRGARARLVALVEAFAALLAPGAAAALDEAGQAAHCPAPLIRLAAPRCCSLCAGPLSSHNSLDIGIDISGGRGRG
jgi:hypothetical protein